MTYHNKNTSYPINKYMYTVKTKTPTVDRYVIEVYIMQQQKNNARTT